MRINRKSRLQALEGMAQPRDRDPNERLPRDFVQRCHVAYGEPGTLPIEADYAVTWGDVQRTIDRAYGTPEASTLLQPS
ncbi:MAG: hypothetical protein IH623_23290 [Verrucomicrobia bacterium]|nr:hypothetical protein [Verrucomicrobiota bacterium]